MMITLFRNFFRNVSLNDVSQNMRERLGSCIDIGRDEYPVPVQIRKKFPDTVVVSISEIVGDL